MKVTLILSIYKNVLDRAKIYAEQINQSLSSLVEKYFNFIYEVNETQNFDISPIVKEMTGIIQLDDNLDPKDK